MDITSALKEPFDPKVVHWRVGSTNAKKLGCKPWEATSGIGLAYVDARDVMKRLDDVCGDYWQVEYPFDGCCRIGIKIDGEWIWRSNGAGETQVEGEKGKFSDAFKRAAVLWGVGRYLYYLEAKWQDLKNGRLTSTPELPKWALPGSSKGNRLLNHNNAVQEHLESIVVVKQAIRENRLDAAIEAFHEIPEEARLALNIAPTKGSVWTLEEKAAITSPEWSEIAQSYFNNP